MRPLLDEKGFCTVCTDGSCELCKIVADPTEKGAKYRELWGITDGPTPPKMIQCVHLGEETGETQECKTCAGRVRLKLFSCPIHTVCTISRKVGEIMCCRQCPDYKTKE